MTSRTRILVLALIGLLLVGAAVGGWFVYDSLVKKQRTAADAELKALDEEGKVDTLMGQTKKLKEYQRLSLPSDAQVASREYKKALETLLAECGARNPTVTPPTQTELARPEANPSYIPLSFKVDIPKTDLATVTEVLRRYYTLDLLHQITHLSIQRTGTVDLATDPRPMKERTDLHVTFTSRALIVNGASPKLPRSLVAHARGSHTAVAGGLGLVAYTPATADPVFAPGQREYDKLAAKDPYHGTLPPVPLPPGSVSGYVYADANKNGLFDADVTLPAEENEKGVAGVTVKLYQLQQEGKDPKFVTLATTNQYGYYQFTGVKPGGGYVVREEQPKDYDSGPATPGLIGGGRAGDNEITGVTVYALYESDENNFAEIPPPPVVKEKPNFSEFIEYNSAIHTIDGDEHTFAVKIKDKINDEDYDVLLTVTGDRVGVKATKTTYQRYKADKEKQSMREYKNEPLLDISKPAAMSNKNLFTVYGIERDGSLLLGERPAPPPPPETPKGKKPVLPPPDPKATVLGGWVALAPRAEKFYRWESGKTLKQIVELSKPEAEKAIRLSKTWFLPDDKQPKIDPPMPVEKKPEPKPEEKKPEEKKPEEKKPEEKKPEEKK